MAQQKSSDSGQQMINILLIGLGAYLVWVYVIEPMINPLSCRDANGNPVPCPPATTLAQTNYCYDQNGNVIQCPAGAAAGSVITTTTTGTTTGTAVTYCYDQNGNHITCPSGVAPGTVINTNTGTVSAAPQGYTAPNVATRYTSAQLTAIEAARAAAMRTRTNLLGGSGSGSGTRGIGGIVPSWGASGGPAFNNFIPGGMTFGGGAGAFGSPAWPPKYVQ